MIVATFCRKEFDFASQSWSDRLLATLEIFPEGMAVLHGPAAEEIPLGRPLVDPDGGEQVTFAGSPESWLRLMATHYATPDLSVNVKARRLKVTHIDEVRVELEPADQQVEATC